MTDTTMQPISPLDRIAARSNWNGVRAFSWIVMAFLATLVGWSFFAELEQVSVAMGEVKPQSKLKVIQHPRGRADPAPVRAGGRYRQGRHAPGPARAGADQHHRDEILVRLDSLALQRARLQSEALGKPLAFPEAEAKRRPDLVRSEREVFDARTREATSVSSSLSEQTRQRELAVNEYEPPARPSAPTSRCRASASTSPRSCSRTA
ncbi:MAG: hypothetical protein WDO24_24410 [Pseudomonadota bacterium]